MNRTTVRNTATLEKAPVTLFARITIGATGAPTLVVPKCQGIRSIARTGVGAYTIHLGLNSTQLDTYQRLMSARMTSLVASGIAAAPDMGIVADNSANLADPNIQIQLSAAGVAAEAASGETLLLQLTLSNTTAV